MRNLKRALSLTLASVMLLGMMVVGSSAASYPDVEDTHNVEAIEVLQAIGVMVGDDNGNFGPDDQVNRAQMAVVMALLLDLDYDYYKGTNPFWDVPSWAEPYVAACYANGIVSGYNATTYGSGDPVTAVQAASMMMRALGYFQYQSDYKDGFELATVRQASKISLLKGVNAASNTTALTRNQVAQLALNTLQTGMVEAKDNTMNITSSTGNGTISVTGGQVDYVYVTSDQSYADAINDVSATSVGTVNDSLILELGEKLFEGSLKKYGDKKNDTASDRVTDDMGRPAVRWVYENKDIGTYVKGSDLKFSYTAKAAKGDMYTKIGASVADSLRSNSGTGDGKYTFEVYVDGAEITSGLDARNYFEKNSSAAAGTKTFTSTDVAAGGKAGQSGNGVVTEVYVIDGATASDPDTVRVVMTNTYLLKATADYNSSRETVNVEFVDFNTDDDPDDYIINRPSFDTSISNDDFNVSGVKEGDYLLATWSYDIEDYVTLEPAEVVSGNVTEYTVSDYVILDGTKYSYNKLVGVDEKSEEFSINQDAKLVLDKYGYIIFVDEAISTSSFVYIQDVAPATNLSKTAIAAAYFGDGTSAEIELKKVVYKSGEDEDGKDIRREYTSGGDMSLDSNVHGWYTYIKDADGKYTLTEAQLSSGRGADAVYNAALAQSDTATQIVFNNKVRFLNQEDGIFVPANGVKANTRVRANANTVFLALDSDDELSVATGVENAPDVFVVTEDGPVTQGSLLSDPGVEISWVEKDGYAQYVFIDVSNVESSVDAANSAADWLFILKKTTNKTVVDGDTYYKFKVVIDGEETERFIDDSTFAGVGDLRYNIKTNSKDYITKATLVDGSKNTHRVIELDGSTIGQKGKTITIAGQSFVISGASELNLVVGKDAKELLKDTGADYETYLKTSAGTIKSLADQAPEGEGVKGTAYVVVDEADSEEIEVLWVYIADTSTLKTELDEGSNSSEIDDALTSDDSEPEVPVTNPKLDDDLNVPTGKTLILKGDVTADGQTISTDADGEVVLNGANVKGDLTVSANATLSGAVAVAAGKTLDLATATVSGTLNATGNVTANALTVSGTVKLGAASALTITTSLAKDGDNAKIEADAGAQLTVPDGQSTALKALAGDVFYDASGDKLATVAAGTYVWQNAGWNLPAGRARVAAKPKPAGWVDVDYERPAFNTTGITVLTDAVSVAVSATQTVTITDNNNYANWAVTSSDATKATATIAEKTITITGVAAGTVNVTVTGTAKANEALTKTYTIPVTVTAGGGEDEPTLGSIAITGSVTKVDFHVGDTINAAALAGITVTGTYSDESTNEIALSEVSISPSTVAELGEGTCTVTLTVSGKSATVDITVVARTATGNPTFAVGNVTNAGGTAGTGAKPTVAMGTGANADKLLVTTSDENAANGDTFAITATANASDGSSVTGSASVSYDGTDWAVDGTFTVTAEDGTTTRTITPEIAAA